MDISILKKIGLNDKDIKVYLALIEYGSNSVRGLVDLTNINRGTVYDILKKLQDLGLATYYHQETKQKFVAEDINKLSKLVEDKERELKIAKNKLSELIPELNSLRENEGSKPTTKLYEGKKGIKLILEDVLETVGDKEIKEYYIYSATKVSDDINKAYPDFTKERIKRRIAVKAISLAKGGGTYGLDERRWLGTEEESATFVLIYAEKCAFISQDDQGNPVGVIIENKSICDTQKIIFNQLWKLIKS